MTPASGFPAAAINRLLVVMGLALLAWYDTRGEDGDVRGAVLLVWVATVVVFFMDVVMAMQQPRWG